MAILYKVYMEVLAKRLREKMEGKRYQGTGFRKGLGMMDNIYVINYLVNKQSGKRRENLMAFFVDLKLLIR